MRADDPHLTAMRALSLAVVVSLLAGFIPLYQNTADFTFMAKITGGVKEKRLEALLASAKSVS